jgi:hypothetical protein
MWQVSTQDEVVGTARKHLEDAWVIADGDRPSVRHV